MSIVEAVNPSASQLGEDLVDAACVQRESGRGRLQEFSSKLRSSKAASRVKTLVYCGLIVCTRKDFKDLWQQSKVNVISERETEF
ncbi:hypothetical protein COCON_G00008730 [Conger conger]|uniref:Uncharacterized protein n=1 Tax=Conger conger TaxID=82655 RepID=A0A9Q1E268_CONCO|nr:hypothetical protein COCON_G00008730 [Conger conger]